MKHSVNWGDWLAPALILVTPLVNFLQFRGYGLTHPESLLAMAILAGVGLTGSLLIFLRQQLRLPFLPWPLFVRALIFAVFFTLFFDIQPEFKYLITRVVPNMFWDAGECGLCTAIFFSVIFVFFYAALHLLKENAGVVISVIFIVALTATVLLPRTSDKPNTITRTALTAPAMPPRPDLPLILHIVLDEHIGIAGVPEDIPGGAALRAELQEFYLRHGFRLYGKAFSPYSDTVNSLPNLVNGTARPYDLLYLSPGDTPYVFSENGWFDGLIEKGYLVKVYQSQYLDFCAGKYRNTVECTTYSVSGLTTIKQLDVKIASKANLLVSTLLYKTSVVGLVQALRQQLLKILRIEETVSEFTTVFRPPASVAPIWARAAAEGLIEDLRDAKAGEAYFAHLLIPHVGLVLDENCRTKSNLHTWYDHLGSEQKAESRRSGAMRPAGYAERYVEYFKQVRCAHRILDEMLRSVSESGAADGAVIVIHSDHGSRISGIYPLQKYVSLLSERDLIDNYSTLFAIRYPGVTKGYDSSLRTVQALFTEQVLGRPFGDDPARVYLSEKEKLTLKSETPLVELPFPDFD